MSTAVARQNGNLEVTATRPHWSRENDVATAVSLDAIDSA